MLRPAKVNLIRIYILAFVLQFALLPLYGLLIEWAGGHWDYLETEMLSAYGCFYAFLSGVLLVLFLYDLAPKHFRRGWSIPALLEKQYRDIPLKQAILYFAIVIGFLFGFNLYFGYTSYASGTLERNLSVPYPLFVLKSLSGIIVCGLIGYGALHLIRGRQYLLLGLLLLASNNFIDLYSRRKYLLALMILILLKFLLDRFKISVRQVLVAGVSGLLLVTVFFPFLFVFRQLTIVDPKNKKESSSFTELYQVSQGNKGQNLEKGLAENEAYRTNQIGRNIEYMKFPGTENRFMNGLLFAFQATQVIPRVFFPAKIQAGKSAFPEAIILFYYGKKAFDMTDNLPVYGYLEFGYWGAFIVGFMQALILILFEWFAYRFQRIHPFLGLSVLIYAIYRHLNLEYHYIAELSQIREIIILFLLIWPVALFHKSFIAVSARKKEWSGHNRFAG
ncbi:MAG: hypothetical protein H6565_14245 [Lewinellaceae bacterium]|nr:hypothetical protein [Lewinellaceae bacterium]